MIDGISPAAGRAALELPKLCSEAREVQELDLAGIHRRQELSIDVGFGFGRCLVVNPTLLKLLARPLTGEAIATHSLHSVLP